MKKIQTIIALLCSAAISAQAQTSLKKLQAQMEVHLAKYEPMLETIHNCPVPTIAAVNGPAAGAGYAHCSVAAR